MHSAVYNLARNKKSYEKWDIARKEVLMEYLVKHREERATSESSLSFPRAFGIANKTSMDNNINERYISARARGFTAAISPKTSARARVSS